MAERNLDDYKPLKFYKDNTKTKSNGFSKFEKGDEHFFALYKDGDIALISQSYTSEAGRDNGIESVRKNSKIKSRYSFDTRGSKYGFSLKAGNGQEIAVSPSYGSKAGAEHVAGRLNGTIKAEAKSKPAKARTAKIAPARTTKTDGRIENYHPLAFYEKHGGAGPQNGFNSFSADDGHYFTYNQDGKIVLISESYTGKAGRDNGIKSVKKNMPIKERYEHHIHKNGKHYFDINAANKQEIATSVWYGTAAAAMVGAAILRGEKAKSTRRPNDEDNYRPLAFYQSHTKGRKEGIETFKGDDGLYYFAVFENDKIRLISEGYPTTNAQATGVASVEKNIKIPERYDYRGPLKNGKYDYRLKAGNNKEIARSIWYGSAAAAATGAAYLMGKRRRTAPPVLVAAPVAAAAPIATPPVAAAAPVVAAVAASAVPVAAATTTTSGGGFGWLKWVLLALLALLALWGLSKCFGGKTPVPPPSALVSCWDGSEAETQATCPSKVTCWDGSFVKNVSACPVEPPETFTCWDGSEVEDLATCPLRPEAPALEPEPMPEPETAMPISAPAALCACGSSNYRIRNINMTAIPQEITALGAFPEFGNSHDLSPSEFYDKLVGRYASSSFDARYLDYLARSLGYGGFSEMSAADFSNTSLPYGTKGLLGSGEKHHFIYARLNVTDSQDLEAFRVRAKNGCDVNFMKTCGNYMYACE